QHRDVPARPRRLTEPHPQECLGADVAHACVLAQEPHAVARRCGRVEGTAMRSTLLLLVALALLAGCAGTTATSVTEEARCRQTGGVWRTDYCESGSGGGGY